MSQNYINPPIVEAVCEFRFAADSLWDATIPGLLYEEIRKEFPHKEQRTTRKQNKNVNTDDNEAIIAPDQFTVFRNDTREYLIQVAPQLLAVNNIKPYRGWQEYSKTITNAYTSLLHVADALPLEVIILRYLNRIEIPGNSVGLGEYLDFRPHLGGKLPHELLKFSMSCVVPLGNEQNGCTLRLQSLDTKEETDTSAILLEVSCFPLNKGIVTNENAVAWLEDAHQSIEDIFEGCLTDKLRALFNEEN